MDEIRKAIQKIWPRKPEKPIIPTAKEMAGWHYSQGPIKNFTYPTEQKDGKNKH